MYPMGPINNNNNDDKSTGIGSDNGLALNRRQAIVWTIDGLVCSRGIDELLM